MNLDTYTQFWMGGVIAFGVVFYMFAIRYAQHCNTDDKKKSK